MAKGTVMLVAFYNIKALGVRYLEKALLRRGYHVRTVFFKQFNSKSPEAATEKELELLRKEVERCRPMLIGLSVMSSMYLETVHQVIARLSSCGVPLVCGGAFATMFPDHFLQRGASYVLRGEGEESLPALADALQQGRDVSGVPSLCWMEEGKQRDNAVGSLPRTLDSYGIPAVLCEDACVIEENKVREGDAQKDIVSYEVIASRGCPFTCSYCCSANLSRLLPQHVPPVRYRSVRSVIEELKEAKQRCRRLLQVRFYDEIFPAVPGWAEGFAEAYRREIGLPFTIWSHPNAVRQSLLDALIPAGLTHVVMGIQSGSERIRKDVFHRYENETDILDAVALLHRSGVRASYDFMLLHPFETIEDLKATYHLVKRFEPPFELQLHGLNFLPGTDIVPMAVEQGLVSAEEMDRILYAPMKEQFQTYWMQSASAEERAWYQMIACLPFVDLRQKVERWTESPLSKQTEIRRCYRVAQRRAQLRALAGKMRVVMDGKAAHKKSR